MASVTLETKNIVDMESFHSECAAAMGFPAFYGRNMNAWIDCLTNLADGGDGMSRFQLGPAELVLISVPDFETFSKRVPEVSAALLECTSIVNRRHIEDGGISRLVLVLE